MARLGRKKLYIDFSRSPEIIKMIEDIKKKIKVTMVIKMTSHGKLEIDIRGSKDDINSAIGKIKEIIRGE